VGGDADFVGGDMDPGPPFMCLKPTKKATRRSNANKSDLIGTCCCMGLDGGSCFVFGVGGFLTGDAFLVGDVVLFFALAFFFSVTVSLF